MNFLKNLAGSALHLVIMGAILLVLLLAVTFAIAPSANAGALFGPAIQIVSFILFDRAAWIVLAALAVLYFLPQGVKDAGSNFLSSKIGKLSAIIALAGVAYWFAGIPGAIYGSVAALAFIMFSGTAIVDAVSKRAPAFLERINRKRREYILNGDREAYAKAVFPPAQHPELYKSVPEDLKRGLDVDGRLVDGRHVTWLSYRHFNDDTLQQAVRESGLVAKRVALFTFAGLVLLAVFNPPYGGEIAFYYPQWANEAGAWGPIVAWHTAFYLNQVLASAGTILFAALAAVLLFPAVWFFGFWRAKKAWFAQAQHALSLTTRDAQVIWKDRIADRHLDNVAYNRAVDLATNELASSPLVPIGLATGNLRAKGDSRSFLAGQLAAQDIWSVWQHTAYYGGTGSGKTIDGLMPRIRRLTKAFRASGKPIGFLVLDGKGTLWSKPQVKAAFADRSDVRVIGVREGQFAFDLLAGMTPQQVSWTFENVAGQLEGKPSADFWLKSASNVLQRSAAMARVLPDNFLGSIGRPYTLLGLGEIATSQETRLRASDVIADMVDANGGEHDCSDELKEALEAAIWFRGEGWDGMAEATKTGIIANFGVVLNKVTAVNDASRMFFRGDVPRDRIVDIMHAVNGGVLMNSMGEAEFGAAGKIINVWIKERLYNEGMKRLALAEAARERGEKVEEVTSVAVIMDEAQALLTKSEMAVFAQSREAGMFLSMATQSISSIISVLGEQDANTLLQLMTTQVFFKTTDKATIDYAAFRGGSFPHAYSSESTLYATQAVREEAVPDRTPAFRPAGSLSSFLPSIPSFSLRGMADAIQYDDRFIQNTQPNSGSDGGASAAAWRHEDKNREALVQGIHDKPAIDLPALNRGQGFAFAIVERAGITRCDILDLKGLRQQEEAEIAAMAQQEAA